MSKPKKPTVAKPKPTPPVLYLRLTDDDEAALQQYIAEQDTPPDRTAVGLRSFRKFMTDRGYLPRPKGKVE